MNMIMEGDYVKLKMYLKSKYSDLVIGCVCQCHAATNYQVKWNNSDDRIWCTYSHIIKIEDEEEIALLILATL